MKYAKYIPELNRRETWEELVTRNKEMHQKRYPDLYNEIEELFDYPLNEAHSYEEEKYNLFTELGKDSHTIYHKKFYSKNY